MKRIILIGLLLLIWITPVMAEEKAKTGADPTDFITRIEPSYEFKRIHDDRQRDDTTDLNLLVIRGDLALTRKLSFRMDVPLINFDPSNRLDSSGFDEESGMGDMVTQILHKPYSDSKKAFLWGLRADLPTATEDELGSGGLTIAPIGVAAFFPSKKWIVAGVVQWFLASDLDNDPLPGKRDRNELSVRPIIIWQPMLPLVSWLNLDPEVKFDFENDSESKINIGLEYGKMLSRTSAFFIKPNVNVGGGDDGWGIKAGLRFMFPKTVLFE